MGWKRWDVRLHKMAESALLFFHAVPDHNEVWPHPSMLLHFTLPFSIVTVNRRVTRLSFLQCKSSALICFAKSGIYRHKPSGFCV